MKNGLFRHPNGGKVLVIDGKERHFPPLRGPQLALDALPVWAMDEEPAPESEFTEEDDALLKVIGDAIRGFRRKAKDAAGNMTSQNRDALPDPQDHRNDFRSGDSVTRDELDAALKAALATDSRSSTRIAVDRKELLGLG